MASNQGGDRAWSGGGLALALFVMLWTAAPARAVEVLDTYGPDGAGLGLSWSLYNPVSPTPGAGGQSLAVPFTLVADATVNEVQTSISGTGTFTLGILADAGLPNGDFLFSTARVDPVADAVVSGLNWSLGAGDYWLVSKATTGSTGVWPGGGSDASASRPWAFTSNTIDTPWFLNVSASDAPAARIDATVVPVPVIPEPQTWALMLAGMVLLVWQARSRQAWRATAWFRRAP